MRQKAVMVFLSLMVLATNSCAAETSAARIVHGQNRFQDQRSLFYGEALVSWFQSVSKNPLDQIKTFLNPKTLLDALHKTPGNLEIYLSTHGVGSGQQSALLIGHEPLKLMDLINFLEERAGTYRLWVDACYTGFQVPELKKGQIWLAPQGEEIEDDLLGLSVFGNRVLQEFGLPDWALTGSQPLATSFMPGPFQKPDSVQTFQQAQSFCKAKGEVLCGWKNWRSQAPGSLVGLCQKGEGPSWLQDKVGDGRAMIWLGCLQEKDKSRFGARSPQILSPELGVRCCSR